MQFLYQMNLCSIVILNSTNDEFIFTKPKLLNCYLCGLYRFFFEYVRDDPQRGEAFGFSTSQLISLTLVPVAAAAYSIMRKSPLPSAGEAPEPATEGKPARPGKKKRK